MTISGGGGLPEQRPDQLVRRAQPAVAAGGQPEVFRARQVIIVGTSGQLLVYSPSQAVNDLIASIAGHAGTDPSSNHFLQGIAAYGPGGSNYAAAQMVAAGLNIYSIAGDETSGWGGAVAGVAIDTSGQLVLSCNGNLKFVAELALGTQGYAYLTAAGLLAANPATPTSPESFHTVTFANSWAQAAGRLNTGYQLNVLGDVYIEGSVTVPAGFAANQNMTTAAPAAYQPAHTQSLTAWDLTGSLPVRLAYTSGGILQFSGPVANTAAGHNLDIPKQAIDLVN